MSDMWILIGLLYIWHVSSINGQCGTKLVRPNAAFTLDLYKELASTKDDNLFFSPLSISMSLAMTLLGARGNTAKELKDTLHLNKIKNGIIHKSFKQLSNCLGKTGGNYTLEVANKLFQEETYSVLKTFQTKLRKFYNVDLDLVDFMQNRKAARATINRWVKQQTNNKITDLIPKGGLHPDTVLVLVNAIYFSAEWKRKFKASSTFERDFQVSCKNSVRVQMMTMTKNFKYGVSKKLDCRVLELPYKGGKMSMYIMLPGKCDGLDDLMSKLTPWHLYDPVKAFGMKIEYVDVGLPKFTIADSFDLKDVLTQLGIVDVFTKGKADLSGIGGKRNIYVSKVLHKTFISVTERGTEAAAVTGQEFVIFSPPRPFNAKWPFLFMIRDNKAKSVVFFGKFMTP